MQASRPLMTSPQLSALEVLGGCSEHWFSDVLSRRRIDSRMTMRSHTLSVLLRLSNDPKPAVYQFTLLVVKASTLQKMVKSYKRNLVPKVQIDIILTKKNWHRKMDSNHQLRFWRPLFCR